MFKNITKTIVALALSIAITPCAQADYNPILDGNIPAYSVVGNNSRFASPASAQNSIVIQSPAGVVPFTIQQSATATVDAFDLFNHASAKLFSIGNLGAITIAPTDTGTTPLTINLPSGSTAKSLVLGGSTSGSVSISVPAAAGTGTTLSIPASNSVTVIPSSASAHQFATAISSGGVITWTQPAASDISGLAASATTDTTNASNISSGTLGAAQLPNPSASTLGGVESLVSTSHQWINTISTSGVPSSSQPGYADIATGAIVNGATATTQAAQDGSTKIATTAYVDGLTKTGVITSGSLGTGATIGSGVTATTQTAGDNSTKVATTAYVATAVGGAVLFGGNGSDGAVTIAASVNTDTRNYNATTYILNDNQSHLCSACVFNTSSTLTLGSSTGGCNIQASGSGTGYIGQGSAYIGGAPEASATSAGFNGGGPVFGGGGASGAVTYGPGGGAGAAGNGGAGGGGGASGGFGGMLSSSGHFNGGSRDGSGGGSGGSGAGGQGGGGGASGSHLLICSAGGIVNVGTGNQLWATGNNGSTGTTLGSGGGGGGGGTIEVYNGTGNIPAITLTVKGGVGGASTGASAAGSGGGGGGFIYAQSAGTTSSATYTIAGGNVGAPGAGGTAATPGSFGLAVTIASKAPTLPNITYNHMNGNAAIKTLAWIELAKKGIRGQEVESEKSHHLAWNGETQPQPFEFLSAYYCKKGSYADLYFAIRNGGTEDSAKFCDNSPVSEDTGVCGMRTITSRQEEVLDTFHNKVLLKDWHYPVQMERAAVGDYVVQEPVS